MSDKEKDTGKGLTIKEAREILAKKKAESKPTPVDTTPLEKTKPLDIPLKEENVEAPKVIEDSMEKYKSALQNVKKSDVVSVNEDLQNSPASLADVQKATGVMMANIQKSLTSLGGGGLGERDVLKLIVDNATNLSDSDLDYIAAQIDDEFTDSAEVILLINEHVPQIVDSAFVNNLVDAGLADAFDSAQVVALITETVDSDYVNDRVALAVADAFDSAQVVNVIQDNVDAQYITDRIGDVVDSAGVATIAAEVVTTTVDSAYVNALVDASTNLDSSDIDEIVAAIGPTVDSAEVVTIATQVVVTTVDSAYVNALVNAKSTLDSSDIDQIIAGIGSDFLDSADAIILIGETVDSAYVNALVTIPPSFDSAAALGVVTDTVDSAYISGKGFAQTSQIQPAINSTFASAPHIIPKNPTQSLGDSTHPWADLYVSGSSIHMGGLVLSEDTSINPPQFKVTLDDSENATEQVLKIDLEVNSIDDLGDVTLDLANLDSDNFLMWDGSKWVNTPLDLSGLEFQQTVDLTTDTAPSSPSSGDLYINSTGGTVDASWTGIAGQTVDELQAVVWSGSASQWYLTTSLGSGSVTSIGSSTPSLKVDATNASTPVLSISNASADSAGLMSSGHFTKLETEIDSDISALEALLNAQGSDNDSADAALSAEIQALKNVDSAQNVRMDGIDSDLTAGLATKFDKAGGNISGDIVVANPHAVKANWVGSNGNSNLSIKRQNDTKILLTTSENKQFQKVTYNSNYGVSGDMDVPHKKYVDDAIDSSVGVLGDQVADNTSEITQLKIDTLANTLFAANLVEEGVTPTSFTAETPISNAIQDGVNNRIIGWRGYGLHELINTSGTFATTASQQLAIVDTETGTSITRGLLNAQRVEESKGNRYEIMTLSPPFKLGDDWIFTSGENPKDNPFFCLKPDNTFAAYGHNDPTYGDSADGVNDLPKICRSWGIINHRVRLDNNNETGFEGGRYHLLVGNPVDRLDPSGGNGSGQAQVTLLLDVQDLIDGTEIETYTHEGETYSTLTKSLSTSRGGIPAVLRKPDGHPDIYLFQPGKVVHQVEVRDFATKDIALNNTGVTLPMGYLYDGVGTDNGGQGKRIAERGKINGLSIVENRYIVFHALNIGIQSFDTTDNTLTMLQATPNWIEYGTNRSKGDQHVPQLLGGTFFFPTGPTGYDGVTEADPKGYRITDRNLAVTEIDIPYANFSFQTSSELGPDTLGLSNVNGTVTTYNPLVQNWSVRDDIGRVINTFPYLDGVDLDRYYVPNVFNRDGTNQSPTTDPWIPARFYKVSEGLSTEVVEDTDFLQNSVIKEHDDFVKAGQSDNAKTEVAYNMAHKNRSAIITSRDAIDDILSPTLKNGGETEAFKFQGLMEHAYIMAPDENHPLYHIIDQQFVMYLRMFEGAKKTEDYSGNIISNNETMNSQRYGNDAVANILLHHIPTGKVQQWDGALVSRVDKSGLPATGKGYPSMRGVHMIPRQDGSLDCYMWIHNPRRTVDTDGDTCPLYRLNIPASVNNSNPFANVTGGWTSIRCALADLDTPTNNPYGNYESDTTKTYQYEINQLTWDMIDPETNKRHYFLQSYNKGSKDYVTQRVFQILFDDSDPDAGSIVPVAGHPDGDNIEPGSLDAATGQVKSYASGLPCKKMDIHDVERCFLFGSPVGLSELYFKGDGSGGRIPEIRNYQDYIPQGTRVTHPTLLNGVGSPVIEEKGIVDNWYKSSTLSFQALTNQPIDENDELSNVFVWYQSAYGLCSLSVSDLGNRPNRVRLENNFQGPNLASLHIEMRDNIYNNYTQDFSSRNLQRFNGSQTDTRSYGSLWFFDYKTDYPFFDNVNGLIRDMNTAKNLYNPTYVKDGSGNITEATFYKRGIMEVRPNETTGRLEIHAIPVGQIQYPSRVEDHIENFTGESVAKVNDVFICSGARASHSSVLNPRAYVFNPMHRTVQRISNTETNMTSPVVSRQNGAVYFAPYGVVDPNDASDPGTALHHIDMLAVTNASTVRQKADTLRTMYTLTGNQSLIASDSNTWEVDDSASISTIAPTDMDLAADSDWDLSWQDSAGTIGY